MHARACACARATQLNRAGALEKQVVTLTAELGARAGHEQPGCAPPTLAEGGYGFYGPGVGRYAPAVTLCFKEDQILYATARVSFPLLLCYSDALVL